MHIEPGIIAQAKVVLANASAVGLVAYYGRDLLRQPADIVRTLLAALFFSLFMQSFHVNVGPSELHFVGAMAIYLTLGFLPTLLGFAAGLLLQGLLFEPVDLPHLAVNSLSLIVPLIAVHYSVGRQLRAELAGRVVSWGAIVKLDAMYYAGVTAMVGFWLLAAEVATPLAAWAAFASSYLLIVICEPLFTLAVVRLLKRHENKRLIATCFNIQSLKLAN
ncbi:MAG: cobalt transport protein CbiM [Candidatus Accumulibacter regalis]|jgi:cobalt/nickel transport system permease protein|uniref:Cobalt transport protein CbiM n=1 Tax=Accumulibacter regalis TaxID=522306 RepID=A0A011P8W1_ACCRE|nr:energy-coupling factor ABC transporter permease [Accumulibacter sp.]EXI83971.1 MAG: cobalt transport protein CbiM [Candidatus Accumulibacter regalis]MBL8369669.1 energy-coupling factor ABC transporter permease [Accumulibacter sp.]HRE72312.1 energy-coupling factor ABC transporter permease [Accumulibacter sp.]HRE86967.1 energy-coupling factor ABC transporter permease [Accumulibacter sp.]HRF04519.1 energy-coupling factor ABC transporter permease [Accumulibacter sp.]